MFLPIFKFFIYVVFIIYDNTDAPVNVIFLLKYILNFHLYLMTANFNYLLILNLIKLFHHLKFDYYLCLKLLNMIINGDPLLYAQFLQRRDYFLLKCNIRYLDFINYKYQPL